MAGRAGGKAGPLPRVAERDHAATNNGGDGKKLIILLIISS